MIKGYHVIRPHKVNWQKVKALTDWFLLYGTYYDEALSVHPILFRPTPPTPFKILMPNLVELITSTILCAPKKEVTLYLFPRVMLLFRLKFFPKFTFPSISVELLQILFWKFIFVLSIIRQHHIPSSINVTVILTKWYLFVILTNLFLFFRPFIFP